MTVLVQYIISCFQMRLYNNVCIETMVFEKQQAMFKMNVIECNQYYSNLSMSNITLKIDNKDKLNIVKYIF